MTVSVPPMLDAKATPRSSEVRKRPAAARSASVRASSRARAPSAVASGSMVAAVARFETKALRSAVAVITAARTLNGDAPASPTRALANLDETPVRSSERPISAPPAKRKITSFAYGAAISAGFPMPRIASATNGIRPVTAGSTASVTHHTAISVRSASVHEASAFRAPSPSIAGWVSPSAAQARSGPRMRPAEAAMVEPSSISFSNPPSRLASPASRLARVCGGVRPRSGMRERYRGCMSRNRIE